MPSTLMHRQRRQVALAAFFAFATFARFAVCAVFAVFAATSMASSLASSAVRATPVAAIAGEAPAPVRDGSAQLVGPEDPARPLHLVLGLEHPKLAEEEAFAAELATPGAPNFHKFLSAAAWNERFAPAAADEQAIVAWAIASGFTVSRRFANRLIVDLDAPAAVVERALGLRINRYQAGSRTTFSNDRAPGLPAALQRIVHSVGGLNGFEELHPASRLSPGPPIGAPADIALQSGARSAYSATVYEPYSVFDSEAYDLAPLLALDHCCNSGAPETTVAIATCGNFSAADFATFTSVFGLGSFTTQQIPVDGSPGCATSPATSNFETTLDVEWSAAWAQSSTGGPGNATILAYEGTNALTSTFTDIFNTMLSAAQARVMTTSWGCAELSCYPASVMETDHGIFLAMTAQGWTLIAAVGDRGATAPQPNGSCSTTAEVLYPASDPNVLAAGGTTLLQSGGLFASEAAWTGGTVAGDCANNDGGTGGGFSRQFAAPAYQSAFGYASRSVPDVALNADFVNSPQYQVWNGQYYASGGTSIVAPELAGYFVQVNAYLDYIHNKNGFELFAPVGFVNEQLYAIGAHPQSPAYPHVPFYDITSGCNSNDVTIADGVAPYCAHGGFDQVSGWGSFNALQLAWDLNWYALGNGGNPGYTGTPAAVFKGPATGAWYSADQTVSWTIVDSNNGQQLLAGVAGFTADWDAAIPDSVSEPAPGSGDGFYSGPLLPASAAGSLDLAAAGQGCHSAELRAWNNAGVTNTQTYGPICYDSIPPVTTATLQGTTTAGIYTTPVTVTLAATDTGSGVKSTLYAIDGGPNVVYRSPFTETLNGTHTVNFFSSDVAGNIEAQLNTSFSISTGRGPVAVAVNIASAVDVNAIALSGKPAGNGGIDTTGSAYAGNLLGSSLTWSGATFKLGAADVPSAVSERVVQLPSAHDGALSLLATGVNGNQTNQAFVVTYTDGTTAKFTQSMSNWNTPQHYAGESIALSMPYKIMSNGTEHAGPYDVYGYRFTLNADKLVKSLTLPNNRNVVVLAIDLAPAIAGSAPSLSPAPGTFTTPQTVTLTDTTPGAQIYFTTDGTTPSAASTPYVAPIAVKTTTTIRSLAIAGGYLDSAVTSGTYTIRPTSPIGVSLAGVANVNAIALAGTPAGNGGIDTTGSAFAGNLLGTSLVWSGTTFAFGAPATPSAVAQKSIALPAASVSKLALLGVGVNGDQTNQSFVVAYTDGTKTTAIQSMSNWNTPQGYPGESIALAMPYKIMSNGTVHSGNYKLYGYAIALDPTKTVASLALPNDRDVVILAVDLVP